MSIGHSSQEFKKDYTLTEWSLAECLLPSPLPYVPAGQVPIYLTVAYFSNREIQ